MKLEVLRISSGEDSTSGLLFDVTNERKFLCYTLEDEHRDSYKEKVMSETRIPAGTYEVKLRTVGGMHKRYTDRFADIHKGTLHVTNIPNFKYILIHCGILMSTLQVVYLWVTHKKITKSTKTDILEVQRKRMSEFIRR